MTYTVVLDAGHGGGNIGAIKKGLIEKELNLKTAQVLDGILQALDIHSVMTRTGDYDISFRERAEIATDAAADLAVVIHYNAGPSSMHGMQCFYDGGWPPDKLGAIQMIIDNAPKALRQSRFAPVFSVEYPKFPYQEHAKNTIRRYRCPAVLVECLFLTHPTDRAVLDDPNGINKIACAITCGILSFLSTSNIAMIKQGKSK